MQHSAAMAMAVCNCGSFLHGGFMYDGDGDGDGDGDRGGHT